METTYRFKPHYSPREIQDGAHYGETGYDVTYRSSGEHIGTIHGSDHLVDPDDESKGWVKEFYFQGADGRTGHGRTRIAAIEDARRPTEAECDWCFSFRVVDWQGAEVPCPACRADESPASC